MENKIKDYFSRYPKSKEVFENGGLLFHTRGAADSFGKSETKKHSRTESNENTNLVDDSLQIAALAKLKETEDLSAISYQEQLNISKVLGLETPDKKGETILKALYEYKTTLKAE